MKITLTIIFIILIAGVVLGIKNARSTPQESQVSTFEHNSTSKKPLTEYVSKDENDSN